MVRGMNSPVRRFLNTDSFPPATALAMRSVRVPASPRKSVAQSDENSSRDRSESPITKFTAIQTMGT